MDNIERCFSIDYMKTIEDYKYIFSKVTVCEKCTGVWASKKRAKRIEEYEFENLEVLNKALSEDNLYEYMCGYQEYGEVIL